MLRARAIALRQHDARQGKPALARHGLGGGKEASYHIAIQLILPQGSLRLAPEHADARPARIGCDEGRVALELDIVVLVAQNCPFDQLARQRIADRSGGLRRVAIFARPNEIKRLLYGGEIFSRGRRGGGEGTRCRSGGGLDRG